MLAKGNAGDAQRDARPGEIERAVEQVRPGHEHHARAHRDEPERGS